MTDNASPAAVPPPRRAFGVLGIYMLVTGLAAAVVLAFPGVVIAGLVVGIVPGVILGFIPTLFFYSLLWWGTRALLLRAAASRGGDTGSRPLRLVVGAASAAIVAVPITLAPGFINAPVESKAAMLQAEDRPLAAPISFPPVVAVVVENGRETGGDLPCEQLCQRLLYNRAATRVIVAEQDRPGDSITSTAYWIERRDTCPVPVLARREIKWPVDFPLTRGADPRSRILARIAAGECLMHEKARVEDAGMTISYYEVSEGGNPFASPWSLMLDTVKATRLDVVEAGGRVIYRRTEVTVQPLSAPLAIETRSGWMTTATYAGWARRKATYAPMGPNGRDVLPVLRRVRSTCRDDVIAILTPVASSAPPGSAPW